ncbi:TIR domain-containing protein [Chloroflexota bacterium]
MSDVFISHVEKDSDIALELALGLEEAGFTTWCYELNSVPGPSYLVQTGQAVEQCNVVVLLISPHSLGSRQVTIEIVRAHECGKYFIPVLRGITHIEFQNRQPEWREAIGSATSICILQDRVANVLTRIIVGLKALGIQPLSKPKAARITMIKMALGIHKEKPTCPTPKVEAKKTPVPRQPAKPAESVKVELPECPECGAKPRPNAIFCNKCGTHLRMGEKRS